MGDDDRVGMTDEDPRGPRPGAPPTGWQATRRWFWVTVCVVAAATLVLVVLAGG